MIELMVVIAIVGLMVTAGGFTLRNVLRSNLRKAAGQTAAAMRFAFNRALVTGRFIRLVLDFEARSVSIEWSKRKVSLRKGNQQLVTTDKAEAEKQEAEEARESQSTPIGGGPSGMLGQLGGQDGEEGIGGLSAIDVQALLQSYQKDIEPIGEKKSYFQPLVGPGVRTVKLPSSIRIASVMTPRLTEPITEGKAYIYFFPQGHSEPAVVQFKGRDGTPYSVTLHPLTGSARIYPCQFEVDNAFGEEDKLGAPVEEICVR